MLAIFVGYRAKATEWTNYHPDERIVGYCVKDQGLTRQDAITWLNRRAVRSFLSAGTKLWLDMVTPSTSWWPSGPVTGHLRISPAPPLRWKGLVGAATDQHRVGVGRVHEA